MILVLLGTHPASFRRIVEWVVNARDAIKSKEKIIVQAGETTFPKLMEKHNVQVVAYLEKKQLSVLSKKARKVICHAAPGILYQIWKHHPYKPIVVPRLSRLNEHVSDHQSAYADYVREQGMVLVATSISDLSQKLQEKPSQILKKNMLNFKIIASKMNKAIFFSSNKKKHIKKSVFPFNTLSLVFLSIFISLFSAYKVAEKLFFDKIFFDKSITYGYWAGPWVGGKQLDFTFFGERSKDLLTLSVLKVDYINGEYNLEALPSSRDTHKILLVGDSYLWGQGLRWEQTVGSLIRGKLKHKKIDGKKVEVYVLASVGDSMFDNYLKLKSASNVDNFDEIFIFVVHNDMLLNPTVIYKNDSVDELIITKCQEQYLKYPLVFNLEYHSSVSECEQIESVQGVGSCQREIERRLELSNASPTNLCVFASSVESIKNIMKDTSIYYILTEDFYYFNHIFDQYIKIFENKNVRFISMNKYLTSKKIDVDNLLKSERHTHSKLEGHPSSYMHTLYAEIILATLEEKR